MKWTRIEGLGWMSHRLEIVNHKLGIDTAQLNLIGKIGRDLGNDETECNNLSLKSLSSEFYIILSSRTMRNFFILSLCKILYSKNYLETGVVVSWKSVSDISDLFVTSLSCGRVTILLFVSWIVSRIFSISSDNFCRLFWMELIFSFFSAFNLFIWSFTNFRRSRTCFS